MTRWFPVRAAVCLTQWRVLNMLVARRQSRRPGRCPRAATAFDNMVRGEESVAAVRVKSSEILRETQTAQDFDCLTESEVYPLFSFHLFDVKDTA